MPGSYKSKTHLIHDLILDEGIDLACINETWVDNGVDVIRSLLCPPGFGLQHFPRVEGQGGGVAVIYRNNITLTEKPDQQQLGLGCLHLMLGE